MRYFNNNVLIVKLSYKIEKIKTVLLLLRMFN